MIRFVTLLLAVLILPVAAAVDSPTPVDVSTITDPAVAAAFHARLERANALLDDGDHAAAIPLLEELVAAHPADGGLWDALGWACYHAKRTARAAVAYERAAAIGVPFRPAVLYNRACCLALEGRTDEAVEALRQALDAGFENRPLIARDEDLTALRSHPDWPELAGLLPDAVAAAGRDAGWRHDLAFWYSEVRRLHPDPFRRTSQAEFERRVAELDARIPALDDEQISMELQRLTVLLADGHSGIRPMPGSRVQWRRLPLQFYAFADGLFVIDADATHAQWIGHEVRRIGSKDILALWAALPAFAPRDNAMGLLDQGPLGMTMTALLRAMGAVGATEDVPLLLRDRDGNEREVIVASEPMQGAHRELVAPRGVAAPLYLAREHEVFWFDALPGVENAVYVQFNVVRDGPDATISEYAQRLRDHLQENPGVEVVALDLRHNGGGNSFLYPPLVRVLTEFQLEREGARLYVLVGRRTFSACQNLATDLDWWTDAIFVGEPTGSEPNQIGESTHSVLPYSDLRAGISSRLHQQSYAGDQRPWIAPDVPVALTAEAFFAGRDPVLEAVVEVESRR